MDGWMGADATIAAVRIPLLTRQNPRADIRPNSQHAVHHQPSTFSGLERPDEVRHVRNVHATLDVAIREPARVQGVVDVFAARGVNAADV